MAIYQDLVDQFGYEGAYNSVKRFVRQLCGREPEQFDRLELPPAKRSRSPMEKARRLACRAPTDTASRGCS